MTWQPLGSLLQNHVVNSTIRRGITAAKVVETAQAILAELFSKEARSQFQATYFKNGALMMACLSAAAAQELRLNEEEFKAKINSKLPQPVVRRIVYLS